MMILGIALLTVLATARPSLDALKLQNRALQEALRALQENEIQVGDSWTREDTMNCGDCGDVSFAGTTYSSNAFIGPGGNRYQSATKNDVSACKTTCEANTICAGFTFVEGNNKCYFRRDTTCGKERTDGRQCYSISRTPTTTLAVTSQTDSYYGLLPESCYNVNEQGTPIGKTGKIVKTVCKVGDTFIGSNMCCPPGYTMSQNRALPACTGRDGCAACSEAKCQSVENFNSMFYEDDNLTLEQQKNRRCERMDGNYQLHRCTIKRNLVYV